jgi:SIR2-like domain
LNDDGKDGLHRPPEPIEEMARLLAQHKLVPFFGAGISRPHLGFDAGELAREMAREIGVSEDTPLSQVSDLFVEKNGEEAFISHLRQKLVVKELDDSKATTHVLLVSLCPNLLYTTNQDNLFELVAAKYGRPYRRVVTVEDISEAAPGERLLYKFHGDADVPVSLVFGAKSYRARMAVEDHPLDIRLRSDLLGKRLLFLGYSIRGEVATVLSGRV